ncbi:proteasome accessory factor PafA2 family protein, partial [Actinomyces bowdenii]
MSGIALGPVRRPVGLETEYGVLGQPGAGGGPNSPGIPSAPANPMVMASRIVQAYAVRSRAGLVGPDGRSAPAVRWDYEGEDPLADMRGGRLDRADADPSQLTDDPERP